MFLIFKAGWHLSALTGQEANLFYGIVIYYGYISCWLKFITVNPNNFIAQAYHRKKKKKMLKILWMLFAHIVINYSYLENLQSSCWNISLSWWNLLLAKLLASIFHYFLFNSTSYVMPYFNVFFFNASPLYVRNKKQCSTSRTAVCVT